MSKSNKKHAKNEKKKAHRKICAVLSAVLAVSMACTPVFAMNDMTEPNPSITAHPEDNNMQPVKKVTAIGSQTFYKIQGDKVVYANRDDGTGWKAVPSSYIKGSSYNVGNVDYGMYIVGGDEVRFVPLSECSLNGTQYEYNHGTKDGATVSTDVDTATNADPEMGTQFYVNVENGIDPDGPEREETVNGTTNDPRIAYDITVSTKTTYQLNATVPMYVCMYGFRGTGNIVTPDKSAYQLKNYSTVNSNSSATITDITKVTHYAKIYDENHSDEKIHTIGYNVKTGKYTYWYSKPTQLEIDQAVDTGGVSLDISAKNINASGECYVIYIDGKWDFKAAGVLDGDALRQTVKEIDKNHPLKSDFQYGGYNFKTQFAVGASLTGGSNTGLALKVTELQAEPATWKLVSVSTDTASMKRGELAMSIAPESAISDASAIDLSTLSAKTDITERGWYLSAPAKLTNGKVADADATTLPIITKAKMAGGNVNAAGCTSVVKVNYTLTPVFSDNDSETNTSTADSVISNRK